MDSIDVDAIYDDWLRRWLAIPGTPMPNVREAFVSGFARGQRDDNGIEWRIEGHGYAWEPRT